MMTSPKKISIVGNTEMTAGDPESQHQGGSDYDPATLAAEAKKGKSARKPFSIPLWLILVSSIAAIICTIVAPSSAVFVTNARDNVEKNAQVMLEMSANKSFADVNNVLDKFALMAYNFAKRPSTTAVIKNAIAGASLQDQVVSSRDWPRELVYTLIDSRPVSTIACLGNSGAANITSIVQVAIDIVAGIPALVGPPGCEANPITCTYYTPGLYTFDFMDTTTLADGGITYWKHFVDANGKLLPADVQEALFDAILATNNTGYITYFAGPDPTVKSKYIYESPNFYDPFQDPNYMYMQGPTSGKEIDRRWNVGLLGSSLYGSVTRNAYDTPYHPKPSHNCQAGGSVTTSLNPFLQANVPSENGVVFLFDTSPQNDTTPKLAPGPMIASSVPGSDISSGYPAKRYAVTSSPSPIVAQVGKFLVSQYSDLRMSGLQTFKTKFDDGKYYYVATMRVTPDTNGAVWQLVVAFPRDDFFKAIDSSINKSIVVIASLSVAGLLLVLCMSFAFTIPLRKLSLRMGEVTQMKFSSLQNGGLEARSLIKEISNLEDTFHIMVQAFASGIKKNQSIVAGKSMAASALSSGPTKKLGSTSE